MSSSAGQFSSIPRIPASAATVALEVTRGTDVGSRIKCQRVVTLIGSRPGCKLLLKHGSVAPVHAAVINDGSHITAVDLLTRSGTFLNSLKLENEPLSEGDSLNIGPWDFTVHLENPADNPGMDAVPFDLEPTPQVIALEHLDSGRILQPNRNACIVGRRQGSDIYIASKRISRAHALLIMYQGHPAVIDLISTRGTLVNDESVIFRVLKDQDILTFADTKFRVRTVHPSATNVRQKDSKPNSSNGHSSTNGVKKAGAARKDEKTPISLSDSPPPIRLAEDQIDIAHVEGAQSWRVADDLDRVTKQAAKQSSKPA